MLQVLNDTRYRADRALLLDGRGSQIWVVAIKATYEVGERGEVRPHDDQEPVTPAPRWSGEPGRSSLLREGELVVAHPGTDVTFNAAAYAPGGRKAPHVDVGVAVGPLKKLLRVHGERVWHKGLAGLVRTAPIPFERLPIGWERAFGGTEESPDGAFASEPRNPVGRGFATSAARLVEKPLPNVEDVLHLIDGWRDRPAPAGLGAIPGDWSPRRERGGTYDEAWRRTRMPLWPDDFDPRFHQSAPSGLASAEPLQGGELVATTGLRPEGAFSFRLPREYFVVETRLAGAWSRQRPRLERVIVEPDERRLVMVWAARLDCGTHGREVEFSRVVSKQWVEP
jgi:hypothetical protein